MYQRDQIIEQLGIQDWSEEKQNEAIEAATLRIGTAITDQLTEQQYNEYEAIVNNNHDVIDAWLEQNIPDYKETPAFKEFEAGYDDDPDHSDPAKLFASLAWVQLNIPQIQEVIAGAISEYKQELAGAEAA